MAQRSSNPLAGKGMRFVRRVHAMRSIGLAVGFFAVAAAMLEGGAPRWLLALVFVHGFAWPHLAAWWASRSEVPYLAEIRNMMIDALLGGLWVAGMKFNLLPSVLILSMMSMNNVAAGGTRLMLRGLGWHLAGALAGMLVFGAAWHPQASLATIAASMPMLVLYPLALGRTTYSISQRLAAHGKEMEANSRLDGLTGVLNRGYWEAMLAAEFQACKSGRRSTASLVLLDIDHFKQLNDVHGHLAGDEALKAFAALVMRHAAHHNASCQPGRQGRGETRQCLVGRYGGEEFGVLLGGASLTQAVEMAERLSRALQQDASAGAEIAALRGHTASVGVAAFDPGMEGHHDWLAQTDRALYEAKRAGRNRIRIAAG
ncbi:diguanylate cyclase [Cupriavidus basilensis]|uniref:diguanylate cyclase n=1 Tax=Cupriavidus basilensis TaxID=68895 RepID=A0ABT6AYU5_9BURK|nr:diguanylate cyclase [Cupriavidus basilensis]MDF3837654.1 diguanylate cyclase [Cupriavidus basilensis]